MYKHTKKYDYLQTARRMANYFITNIPSDGIVPWDFDAPLVPAPRPADSSAAMIAVNGILLLAEQEKAAANPIGSAYYTGAATKVSRCTDLLYELRADSCECRFYMIMRNLPGPHHGRACCRMEQ